MNRNHTIRTEVICSGRGSTCRPLLGYAHDSAQTYFKLTVKSLNARSQVDYACLGN